MNKYLIILLSLLFPCVLLAQNKGIRTIDNKGTIIYVDPSKWYQVGSNLFNKNTNGNVAIGVDTLNIPSLFNSRLYISNNSSTTIPALKLDKPFDGELTDDVLTWDPLTFSVRKVAINTLSPNDWHLLGNAGTDPAINFLGTLDDQPLKFRIENTNAGSISKLNTSLGYMTLNSLNSGKAGNTAIGVSALRNNTDGQNNTAIGYNALITNTTGLTNTAVGALALSTNTTGGGNSAFGQSSSYAITTATYNSSFGYGSLLATTIGRENSAFGYSSLNSNTIGEFNSALGSNSLRGNTSGINNTAMGYFSLGHSTTGNNNIGVGYYAGLNINGNNNIAIGEYTIYDPVNYNTLYTGSKNIVIGYFSTLSGFTASNEMNIGNTLFGTSINGAIATPTGKIGINVQNPSVELDVNGQARVRNLPTVVVPTTDNLVTADANGVLHQRTVADAVGSIGWLISGNTGTNPANNFLGTTDDQPLMFRFNGQKSGMVSTATKARYNTALGYQSLSNWTGINPYDGAENTALGFNALANGGNASDNTAIGNNALASVSNSSFAGNTAVGAAALSRANGITLGRNTAVGFLSLTSSTSGSYNTALGASALNFNTTGGFNTAIGNLTLQNATTGSYNIAIGNGSGSAGNYVSSPMTGSNNILIGGAFGITINTSSQTISNEMNIGNTLFGTGVNGAAGGTAGRIGINTNNPGNTFEIKSSLANTSGLRFTNLNSASTTATGAALGVNATGDIVVLAGSGATAWSLTGNSSTNPATNFLGTIDDQPIQFRINSINGGVLSKVNTAFGYEALNSVTLGTDNTAIGEQALKSNVTGSNNAAFGTGALQTNTGSSNSAFGYRALTSNTTGGFNSAFGINALYNATSGGSNSAFGGDALSSLTTGGENSAFGYEALHSATSEGNSAFGQRALTRTSTGGRNTAVGDYALQYLDIGSNNTALGYFSGSNLKGSNNIAIGYNTGYSGLITYTGSNNILLGDSLNTSGAAASNELNIGNTLFGTGVNNAIASATGKIGINILPSGTYTLEVAGNVNATGGFTSVSDMRYKKNIATIQNPLATVSALRGTQYEYRANEFPSKQFSTGKQLGVIAQEVEKVLPELVTTDKDGYKSVNYIGLVPVLLEGMKAQQTEIKDLKSEVDSLKKQMQEIQDLLKSRK